MQQEGIDDPSPSHGWAISHTFQFSSLQINGPSERYWTGEEAILTILLNVKASYYGRLIPKT